MSLVGPRPERPELQKEIEKEVPEFKQLLVKYYEGEEYSVIATFLKKRCWKTMQF